jgi:hypothetical protein
MIPIAGTVTGKVHTTSTCHCCFTSLFKSVYFFSFFRSKQFASYLTLVRWYQLNKIFLLIPLFSLGCDFPFEDQESVAY